MPLTLVAGAKKSGKTKYLIDLMKNKPEGSYMLVPEKNLLFYEKMILEKLGEASAFIAETLSFRKLSLRLIEDDDKFGIVRLLDNETRNMLLASVIMRNKKKLKLYKDGGKSDYAEMISSQLTEFKRHLITPEILNPLIEKRETPASLRDKLSDICTIYPEYEKVLSGVFADCDDIITTASDIALKKNAFKEKKIYIDGFTGFTAQELLMIKTMLDCGAEVYIALDYIEEYGNLVGDIYYSVGKTKKKLLKLDNNAKIIKCDYNDSKTNERNHILNNYLTGKQKYNKETERLFYSVFPSLQAEASAAASYVAEKISQGADPGDFLIVAGEFEKSLHYLGRYFDGFKIPYYGDIKKSVAEMPVFAVVESICEIILNIKNIDSAVSYLKSVCISEEYREDGFIFENFLRASGIKGYTLFNDDGAEKMIESAYNFDESVRPNIIKIYNKFILPVIELRKSLKKSVKAKEYASALYELFEEIELSEIVSNVAEEYENDGNRVMGLQYVQVYNTVIKILEKCCLVLGDDEISFPEFKNLLIANLSEKSISGVPLGFSCVLITGLHSVPAEEFPYVILLNANDGVLIKSGQEGFINEEDRKFMLSEGIELSLAPEEKITEEYLKTFSVITSFEKELHISSSRFDKDGGEMVESDAIGYLKDIFADIREWDKTDEIYTKRTLLTSGLKEIYSDNEESGADKMRRLYNDKEYSMYADEVIKKIGMSPKTDITIPGVPGYLPKSLPMSITSYEKYRSCGFSYYIKYILKGREKDIYSIDTAGIGSLSHLVLQRFSEKVKKDGKSFSQIDNEYIEKTIDPIVKRAVREVNNGLFASGKRAEFMAKKVKRSVKRTLTMIKEHFTRGDFLEYGFEISFGREGALLPGFEIELGGNRKILLNGTIDRVDIYDAGDNEYVRIVDYKSRAKTLDLYEIYYGINIQMITYLMVMLKSEISKKLLPGGVLYLSMDNPIVSLSGGVNGETLEAEIRKKLVMHGLILKNEDIAKAMDRTLFELGHSDIIDIKLDREKLFKSTNVLSVEEFNLLFEKTLGNIKEEAKKIYGGKFDIHPVKSANKSSCEYCPYAAICCFDEKLCKSDEIPKETNKDILERMKKESGEVE